MQRTKRLELCVCHLPGLQNGLLSIVPGGQKEPAAFTTKLNEVLPPDPFKVGDEGSGCQRQALLEVLFYICPKVSPKRLFSPFQSLLSRSALLYSILFAFWSRCKLPCMAGCVCVCMRAAPCVRLCECVTRSWFELCRLHAHPGSVLRGNVGVVSARPLTLGLSTCITHTHTYPYTRTRTHRKIYKRTIPTKTPTH